MRNIAIIFSIPFLVTSCGQPTFQQHRFGLKETAAVKALGPGAISTALVSPKTLKPGRIYHQSADGSIHEICDKDFREQAALKSMTISSDSRPDDEAEDTVYKASVALPFGAGKARLPYDRVKVTGFTVNAIENSGSVPEYILSNLAKKCRTETLKRNRPYYITSSVAVADKAETFSRDFVDAATFGPFEFEGDNETKSSTRKNVVFGAKAKYVSK